MASEIEKCLKTYDKRKVQNCKKAKNGVPKQNAIERMLMCLKNFQPLTLDVWPFKSVPEKIKPPEEVEAKLADECSDKPLKYHAPDVHDVYNNFLACFLKDLEDANLEPEERRKLQKLRKANKAAGIEEVKSQVKYKTLSPEFYLLLNKRSSDYDQFVKNLNRRLSVSMDFEPDMLSHFLNAMEDQVHHKGIDFVYDMNINKRSSSDDITNDELVDFLAVKFKNLFDKIDSKDDVIQMSPLEMQLLLNDIELVVDTNKGLKISKSIQNLLKKAKINRDSLSRDDLKKLAKFLRNVKSPTLLNPQKLLSKLDPTLVRKILKEIKSDSPDILKNKVKYLFIPEEAGQLLKSLRDAKESTPEDLEKVISFLQRSAILNANELFSYLKQVDKAVEMTPELITKLRNVLLTTYTGLSNAQVKMILEVFNDIDMARRGIKKNRNLPYEILEGFHNTATIVNNVYAPLRRKKTSSSRDMSDPTNLEAYFSPIKLDLNTETHDNWFAFRQISQAAKKSLDLREAKLKSLYSSIVEKHAKKYKNKSTK